MKARIASALVLLLLSTGADPAIAQSQPAGTGASTPPAPAQVAAEPSRPAEANPHADADARACLEFVSNVGVIRCAEKFRTHTPERRVR